MTTTELIEAYKAEYIRANGKECTVVKVGGWFKVNGDKGVGHTKFNQMLETLKSRPTVTRRQEMVNGVLTWIEAHQHVVKSLLSPHMDVIEDRDTPNCCSVASETYWSM